MAVASTCTYFPQPRPAVMVVSHERSGTHFLMNAIAACFGYVSLPWIDLDLPTANILHAVSREQLRDTLMQLAARPLANIIKSHHPADFFAGELPLLTERYVIFAIVRDPAAVLLSLWRYLHRFAEGDGMGPRVADPLVFARTAPAGRMVRYQQRPYSTMLDRWAAHVETWRTAAATHPRIHLIRYEDLDTHYVETLDRIGDALGLMPLDVSRPARDYNVIPAGPLDPTASGIAPDTDALRRLCRQTVGETMARLGYSQTKGVPRGPLST